MAWNKNVVFVYVFLVLLISLVVFQGYRAMNISLPSIGNYHGSFDFPWNNMTLSYNESSLVDLVKKKSELLTQLSEIQTKIENLQSRNSQGKALLSRENPEALNSNPIVLSKIENQKDKLEEAKSPSVVKEMETPNGPKITSFRKASERKESVEKDKPPLFPAKKEPDRSLIGINITKDMIVGNTCPYSVKVYVYDLPTELPSVRLAEEARRNGTLHICHKCILEQFSLEYIIHDYFTQFCGRTYNPKEADYFYLPIIRDAEYRTALSIRGPPQFNSRAPSATEEALLAAIEKNDLTLWKKTFQITDEYWKAHQGRDHLLVMPAPVTNFRHEGSRRGFFHYMIHLTSPIYFGVEYSKGFVEEYPICATQKNFVLPYPTTDPEFYSGKLFGRGLGSNGIVERTALLYYAGGTHGDCMAVRKAIRQVMINSTRIPHVIPTRIASNQEHREQGFRASIFCPIPIGDSPSSKRMYDVLNFGCIPVVLSDDLVWAFTTETGGSLKKESFSLTMPQHVVQHSSTYLLDIYASKPESMGSTSSGVRFYDLLKQGVEQDGLYYDGIYINPLIHILRRISKSDIHSLQVGVQQVSSYFRFYSMDAGMTSIPTKTKRFPDGKVMELVMEVLEKRKIEGISKIADACVQEKKRAGHQYQARYPCDPSTARRRLDHWNGSYQENAIPSPYLRLENYYQEEDEACLSMI